MLYSVCVYKYTYREQEIIIIELFYLLICLRETEKRGYFSSYYTAAESWHIATQILWYFEIYSSRLNDKEYRCTYSIDCVEYIILNVDIRIFINILNNLLQTRVCAFYNRLENAHIHYTAHVNTLFL